jgi:membrane protease YdiL (CAAX protease family)
LSSERKAALILGGILLSEGAWLVANLYFATPARFLRYCGFHAPAGFAAWTMALAVAAVFVFYSARIPSVRANLLRFGGLKVLAIGVGIAAGFCEEAVFRKMLMDHFFRLGWTAAAQVAISAVAFGAAHAIWGLFRGNFRAAIGAMIATGSLGFLLAVVYLLGGRNLAPCIVSHFLINLFAEPGLVLSALRGEMGSALRLG